MFFLSQQFHLLANLVIFPLLLLKDCLYAICVLICGQSMGDFQKEFLQRDILVERLLVDHVTGGPKVGEEEDCGAAGIGVIGWSQGKNDVKYHNRQSTQTHQKANDAREIPRISVPNCHTQQTERAIDNCQRDCY